MKEKLFMIRKLLTSITSVIKRIFKFITNSLHKHETSYDAADEVVHPFESVNESYCPNEEPTDSESDANESELIWPFVHITNRVDIIEDDFDSDYDEDDLWLQVFQNVGYDYDYEPLFMSYENSKNSEYVDFVVRLNDESVSNGYTNLREYIIKLDDDAKNQVICERKQQAAMEFVEYFRRRDAIKAHEEAMQAEREKSRQQVQVTEPMDNQTPPPASYPVFVAPPMPTYDECNKLQSVNRENMLNVINNDRENNGMSTISELPCIDEILLSIRPYSREQYEQLEYSVDEFIEKWIENHNNETIDVPRANAGIHYRIYYFDNVDLSVIYDFESTNDGIMCNQRCTDEEKWQYLKTLKIQIQEFQFQEDLIRFMNEAYIKCCYLIHLYSDFRADINCRGEYFLTSFN